MAVAGTTHDVVLDNAGYMLATGRAGSVGYQKGSKTGAGQLGMRSVNTTDAEALLGTVAGNQARPFKRQFWGSWRGVGQKFAEGWGASAKVGRVNDQLRLAPALGGAALALAPQGVSAQADATAPGLSQMYSTNWYGIQVVSVDKLLFTGANPGTNSSGLVLKATSTTVITGMGVWNGTIYVGDGASIRSFDPTTGALATFGVPIAADLVTGYQNMLVISQGARLTWYIAAVGAWATGIILDSQVVALEELEGSLYIGTYNGNLYRLQGTLKAGSPATAPGTLNQFDFSFELIWKVGYLTPFSFWTERPFVKMTGWRGALWFFAGNQLMKATPSGGHLAIELQAVQGASLGLAVCGRSLVVVTRNVFNANASTVWVNDGTAGEGQAVWWKLDDGGTWCYPFGNASYSQGQVNAFQYGITTSHNFTRWLLDPTSPLGFRYDNYGRARTTVSGKVTLPLVMPEDFEGLGGSVGSVQLLRVGVEWQTIDGGVWWPTIDASSTAACKVQIEVSLDGGNSWTYLINPANSSNFYAPGAADFRASRFEFPVAVGQAGAQYPASPGFSGAAVADPGWLVRITWEGTIMPLLRRVWLDYKPVEVLPTSGLGWDFELNLTEPIIGLDGAVDNEAALTKLGRLWTLWKNANTVNFTDLDAATTYKVKVVGLEQKRVVPGVMPNLAQGWSASVRLVEVTE